VESVINWVIANINEGRILTTIRVCEPYASELIVRDIVPANIVFPPLAGQQHLIFSIDEQNIEWCATLTV
jgi:hypothetical protein